MKPDLPNTSFSLFTYSLTKTPTLPTSLSGFTASFSNPSSTTCLSSSKGLKTSIQFLPVSPPYHTPSPSSSCRYRRRYLRQNRQLPLSTSCRLYSHDLGLRPALPSLIYNLHSDLNLPNARLRHRYRSSLSCNGSRDPGFCFTKQNPPSRTAMFTFFRCFGQTIGVTIDCVMFQNRMAANLRSYPALASSATPYSLDVVSLIRPIDAMPNSDPTKPILNTALSHSIRPIWALMCGLAAWLSYLRSSSALEHDLNQVLSTGQGFDWQEKKMDPETAAAAVLPAAVLRDEKNADEISRDVSHDSPTALGEARVSGVD